MQPSTSMAGLHRSLLVVAGGLAVAALAGLVVLWPARAPAPDRAVTTPLVDGLVRSALLVDCPEDGFVAVTPPCVIASVEIVEGPHAGTVFEVDTGEQGYPAFEVGDRLKVGDAGMPDAARSFYVQDHARLGALGWLFALFAAAVLGIGRWHGLRSLLGLALSLLVVVRFLIPAILAGRSPLAVALVGAFLVMVATLYLAHGFNPKTTTALIGTSAALLLTALLGVAFAEIAELTGLSSEEAQLLQSSVAGLNLRGLVLAGLVIGALGVLDDVTVGQASTVFALHDADPEQSRARLFRRGMGVGRDHIASVVNTLVLAYAGASVPLLVLFATGGLPLAEIVNAEYVAQEIVKTLIGSIGLVSAVPLTTALAASVVQGRPPATDVREEDDAWLDAIRSAARSAGSDTEAT